MRFALVRTEEWAPDTARRSSPSTSSSSESARHVPNLDADRADAHDWISERVELVQELAADGRPRAGADCSGCAFISGCDQHPG